MISKPYLHDKIEFEIAEGSFDVNTKNKISDHYNFLNKIEKKKFYESLKLLTEFQIKNFEMEFYKNNKKLIELENLRIQLVRSYLYKKKNFNHLMKIFRKR